MRSWKVVAGLAAALVVALLAVALLRSGAGKPPAPGAPEATPGGVPDDAMHHAIDDANSRAVRAYPITLERLQAYVAAVKEVRAAGTRDPALLARLRSPGPPGEQPSGLGARLDAIAPLKAILERHGLFGIDLVLMPQVVIAGRNAYALEQEQRPLPASQVNPAAVALWRADLPRMDGLTRAFLADLRYLNGP